MEMNGLARRSILVADDDLALNEMVRGLLEREGYQVDAAYDGLQAVESVRAGRYDLVVLDINMPKLDGWDVLWDIRNNPDTESLPVIMLTVEKDGASITRGWSSGVDCYLAKPFDSEEMVTMVNRLVQVMEDQTIPVFRKELPDA